LFVKLALLKKQKPLKRNIILAFILVGLIAIAAWFFSHKTSSTLNAGLNDFAYKDTASITKIFLADKFGHSVLLERTSNGWNANGKPAMQSQVIFLLDAIKNIEVRHPAAKAAYNNIMKQMAATGIKVEIYVKDKNVKTYYVGHETQDQMGTYMYMQNSDNVYAMHIPGFNGILNVRYNTNEKAWWKKNVFSYAPEEIASITVENFLFPEKSFQIVSNESFELFSYPSGKKIDGAAEEKILNYVSFFSDINYEKELASINEQIDSAKKAGRMMHITVKTKSGDQRIARLYRKPRPESDEDDWERQSPDWSPYDPDRFYLEIDSLPETFLAQYFVFRKLMRTPEDFLIFKK
jgi:hypothetical protein